MASSSTVTHLPPPSKHDVFLSFRGEDTRDNFTSHLHKALCKKKMETYIDYRIEKGQNILPSLLKAIEQSEIFVIIFSKTYASSTWCLNELTKILECKQKLGRAIVPVFYNIDPSDVRKQSGSYADAFVKHEQNFKDNIGKVQRWRESLSQVAQLSGWDSSKIRPESMFIREIVKDILRKLNCASAFDFKGLVGIHDQIGQIEVLLASGSPDVCIVGIWGMGGIGKTTLAETLFSKFKAQFESYTFVPNVREQIERAGLDHIRDKYLSKLLEDKGIGAYSLRSTFLKKRLQQKKILLVLDDVNNSRHIEDLIGGHDWFGSGSRIIVTTRDMQVLKNVGANLIYQAKELNFDDALELFSLKAFKKTMPTRDFAVLSLAVVNYCNGIPLALKVLGSYLYGRRKYEWESALQRLRKAPQMEVFNVLKLSYDELDDEQKDIFLDIACFYRGMFINYAKQRLEYCGYSTDIGISVLTDRCLIFVRNSQIGMHDLIEAMGQEIVRRQSIHELGKRSRLWNHDDIYHVLRQKTVTEAVQCISLDMSKIKEINLHSNIFEKMHNLKLLHFHMSNPEEHSNVRVSGGLKSFPYELRVLQWDGYPLRSLPLSFSPENLVELDMRDSQLEKLWDEDQKLPNLRRIDLRGSKQLVVLPDLSHAPNIEEIILNDCTSLLQVYSSNSLLKLNRLWLDGCAKLKGVNLPRNVYRRSSWLVASYRFLDLENFSFNKVTIRLSVPEHSNISIFQFKALSFPFRGITESMDSLECEELKLLGESLTSVLPCLSELRWSSSIVNLSKLLELDLSYYNTHVTASGNSSILKFTILKLTRASPRISTTTKCSINKKEIAVKEVVSSLEDLIEPQELTIPSFAACSRLSKIPNNLSCFSLIKRLSLHKRNIVTLAATIPCHKSLKSLKLCDCKRLQSKLEFTLLREASRFSLAHRQEMNQSTQICISFVADAWLSSVSFAFRGKRVGSMLPKTKEN